MKSKKIILIITIILSIFFSITPVYATQTKDTKDSKEDKQTTTSSSILDSTFTDGDKFFSNADDKVKTYGVKEAAEITNQIYGILMVIGMAVAVIVGTILGIKFMISTVDEKANIKGYLVAYVIGCVVLFGAFTIWKIVISLLNAGL